MGTLSRVAERLPEPLFVRAVAALYGRIEGELRRLDDFAPPGGIAIDVGCWYGPWTRALSRRSSRVLAFEPNPHVAGVLRRTVPTNVTVIEAVAGAYAGTSTLWVPPRGMGTEGVASTVHHDAGDVPTEVSTTTIDEVTLQGEASGSSVHFIKIDVEGAEHAVLQGAVETLARHRPNLLIELEYHRSDVSESIAFLEQRGYSGEVLVGGHWTPLSGFDLQRHQDEVRPRFEGRGMAHRLLRGGQEYINNVVFRPE